MKKNKNIPQSIRCPKCGKNLSYGSNEKFYGKQYGKSFMAYFHKECDVYVGTHSNSFRPVGTPADKETRKARMRAHKIVDALWKGKHPSTRGQVYRRLSEHFGRDVHFGSSNIQQCEEVIEYIKNEYCKK